MLSGAAESIRKDPRHFCDVRMFAHGCLIVLHCDVERAAHCSLLRKPRRFMLPVSCKARLGLGYLQWSFAQVLRSIASGVIELMRC